MGLLQEIQNDALSDTTPVSTLLRKVMVLGSNIDSNLIEDWVRHELSGYPNEVEVPDYRIFMMNFKVSGANARWQLTGHAVPQALVCQLLKDDEFPLFRCRQAIGTINEDEIKASKGRLIINMDNYALLLHGKIFDRGFSISRFWAEVSASQVLGILEAVRNRVLDFVLALKKSYPDAGEVYGISIKEPAVEKVVSQIFNTTINGGNAGVIGSATNSTVNVSVNQGNLQDLRQQLMQNGVDKADIKELEEAVQSDPQVGPDKKFGPSVTEWIAKMMGKAASGVWGAGLEVGGEVVKKALLGYYGLNG